MPLEPSGLVGNVMATPSRVVPAFSVHDAHARLGVPNAGGGAGWERGLEPHPVTAEHESWCGNVLLEPLDVTRAGYRHHTLTVDLKPTIG